MNKDNLYEKEKRILIYVLGWLIVGFCILFFGINNVFAEEITPIEIKSQIRTIYTDGSTQWYTSANSAYGNQLYFGSGPSYSTYGIPLNFRLLVVQNIDSKYSYKYNYSMTIYTPYSTSNTWDSTKIDKNYDIRVGDDTGIVKENKCSVVNTEVINGNTGIYTTKEISCTFSVNKSYTNGYISAGYFCKTCNLSGVESLGYIPQDSYMIITNPRIEKFEDNSNVIIDQNQTIIDQNNTTNEKLDDIIDNQNSNTDKEIQSQKVCKNYDYTTDNVLKSNGYLTSNGSIVDGGNSFKHTDYIKLQKNETYTLTTNFTNNNLNYCLYTYDKTLISCQRYNSQSFTIIPTDDGFIRYSTRETYQVNFTGKFCENGNQALNDKLNDLQGSLNNPNIDGSLGEAGGFFNNFSTTDHGGVSGIITAPLVAINQMLNKSCNPMSTNFKGKEISLPCGYDFWSKMGPIQDFLNLVLGGLLCYQIIIKLFKLIEKIKNPEDDRVEVMKL